jgi:hypothetical protein
MSYSVYNESTQKAKLALAQAISESKKKLDSTTIKALLFDYFRFQRSFLGVLSEFNFGNIEDFIAFKRNEVIAVEIKISKSDFKHDFIKRKYKQKSSPYHKFYFCVPSSLKDFGLEILKQRDGNFLDRAKIGLLVIDDNLNVNVAKKAQLLQPKSDIFKIETNENSWNRGGFVNENLVYYLIQQMSGELAKCKILK